MGRSWRAVHVIVLSVMCCALSVACTTGPAEPKPLKTSTETPKRSPTTAAGGIEAPRAADAVRRYFDLISEAEGSGDVSALRQASAAECEECKRVADYISDLYERGGRYEGDHKVKITELVRIPDSDPPAFTVYLTRNSYELVPEAGAKPTTQQEQKTVWGVTVEERGGRWLVAKFANET